MSACCWPFAGPPLIALLGSRPASAPPSLPSLLLGPLLLRLPGWLGLGGFAPTLARLASLPLWYLLLAVLVGGVAEEILYHGYALDRLGILLGSPWFAGLMVVLLFGLGHIPLWGIGQALTTTISGAALTLFFLWHGDLLANIIAHVATDFAGIVLRRLIRAFSHWQLNALAS